MAGDWIAWTKGLTLKREVVAIANRLGLDRRVVACLCMEAWEWRTPTPPTVTLRA